MTAKEVLQAAREKIADAKHWTQGTFAKTVNGYAISEDNPNAVSFCLAGSIFAVAPERSPEREAACRLIEQALTVRGSPSGLGNFNDTHSHEEVLALMDEAIAEA